MPGEQLSPLGVAKILGLPSSLPASLLQDLSKIKLSVYPDSEIQLSVQPLGVDGRFVLSLWSASTELSVAALYKAVVSRLTQNGCGVVEAIPDDMKRDLQVQLTICRDKLLPICDANTCTSELSPIVYVQNWELVEKIRSLHHAILCKTGGVL